MKPILLISFLAAMSVSAQQYPLVRDHAGVWQTRPENIGYLVPPADKTTFLASVTKVLDVLRRSPALAAPKGFDVIEYTSARLDRLDSGSARPQFVGGTIHLDFGCYETGPKGVFSSDHDFAGSIVIEINDLVLVGGGTVQDGYVTFGDDQGDFIKGAREPDDTLHGFPVYEQGNDRWIVIRKPGVPILVPVSRERYLKFRLKKAQTSIDRGEANLAKMPANNAQLAGPIAEARELLAQVHAAVGAMNTQLAGMSAADRAAPAFVISGPDTEAPQFDTSADNGADPILTLNPALMSAGAPRGSAQILAVSIRADDKWPDLATTLDAQIDWTGLAAIVK